MYSDLFPFSKSEQAATQPAKKIRALAAHNKPDLVQRVNQESELVKDAREAPPVATITREQMQQDVGINYVKRQTVHPNREDWHDKVAHLRDVGLLCAARARIFFAGCVATCSDSSKDRLRLSSSASSWAFASSASSKSSSA